jgi:hypothetical protein
MGRYMKLRNGIISPANSDGCEYQYVMHGLSFDVWFIQHMCKIGFTYSFDLMGSTSCY